MNGIRVARKYIERSNDEDLQRLWELAKDDPEHEAVVITHLIECEMKERHAKHMKEIIKALRALGIGGTVTTSYISLNRYAVYVDDKYFGIWDTMRQTFVD